MREFLRHDRAYLCFASKEELAAAAEEQRAEKVPTGYYGRWALWRDAPADRVREGLAAGDPYVVRFRSPGAAAGRITYTDLIRGAMEAEDNRNDVVILKSSANALRLPTYHFAHVVDDHLMRVSTVIRGEEWLSSVPTHLQLFDAAGFERIPYAHIAPLMKQEGSSRRKLSKRKDPEANVEFYITAGYPADGVLYYLRCLANARLSELPVAQALREPLRLEECGVAGPLVDLVKLEDITADLIAAMPSAEVLEQVTAWAAELTRNCATHWRPSPAWHCARWRSSARVSTIPGRTCGSGRTSGPRTGTSSTRCSRASDPHDERFGGIDPADITRLCTDLLAGYQSLEDSDAWFGQLRTAAEANGFASSVKEYKNPGEYVGSIREASQIVRVLLTGSTRSPAMHLVAAVLGEDEVRRRIGAVLPG